MWRSYTPWLAGLLLAGSTASTKAAGAAWLLICLWAAWLALRHRTITAPLTEAQQSLQQATRLLALWVLAGFVLHSIGVIYWSDPWSERHFDFRLLITAGAAMWLVTRAPWSERLIGVGPWLLLIAGVAGMAVGIYANGSPDRTPTNTIPWGGGMALLAMVGWTYFSTPLRSTVVGQRWHPTVLAMIALLMAVLLSGARGAYGAILWVVIVLVWRLLHPHSGARRWNWRYAAGVVGVVAVFISQWPQALEFPQERAQLARTEIERYLSAPDADLSWANTSVGARLYMLEQTVQTLPKLGLWGAGREQRLALIQSWGQQANSPTILGLGHIHNEYLQQALDHGIWGISAYLCYLIGLLVFAWRLRIQHPWAALSVLSMAFVLASTSLTNVNTAHNYTGVMLGLSVLWVVAISASSAARQTAKP